MKVYATRTGFEGTKRELAMEILNVVSGYFD